MLTRTMAVVMCGLAAGTLAPDQARGEMITFYFGGDITSVDDPLGTLGGAVQVNDEWSGSYTFDPNTPDSYPNDPEVGEYESPNASMELTLGTITIEADGSQSSILVSSRPIRAYFRMGCFAFDFDGIPVGELGFSLTDWSGAALSTDALPLEPPDLGDFPDSKFFFAGWGDPLQVAGTVEYLVPEPSAVGLLCPVSLMMLSRRRRY